MNGTGIMMPGISLDDRPIKHVLTIKPGANGFAVFVEEDIRVKKSFSKNDILNSVSEIAEEIQGATSQEELHKIIRQNNMKPDADDIPEVELGMHVFKTISELQAFVSHVYELDAESQKKYQIKKNPSAQKYNSQMT